MSQTPAGWYPSEGQMRWWDGERWTEHRQPMPTQAAARPAAVVQPRKGGVPTWVKVGGGIVGGLVVLGVIGSAMGGESSSSSTTLVAPAADQTSTSTRATSSKAAATKATPADSGTLSQQNALRAAQSYLETQAFSRAGLIQQLSSSAGDGYSVADATWGVDHLGGVDWNEQAVRSAKSYLATMAFSRSGLIQQLSSTAGEKFTKAQATHAADVLGLH